MVQIQKLLPSGSADNFYFSLRNKRKKQEITSSGIYNDNFLTHSQLFDSYYPSQYNHRCQNHFPDQSSHRNFGSEAIESCCWKATCTSVKISYHDTLLAADKKLSWNLISQKTYRCLSDCISAISCGTSPLKSLLLKSSISNIARALNSLGIGPLNKLLESTLQVDQVVKPLSWVYQLVKYYIIKLPK